MSQRILIIDDEAHIRRMTRLTQRAASSVWRYASSDQLLPWNIKVLSQPLSCTA